LSDPRAQLLEVALERHFRGAAGPDLAERVADAWERARERTSERGLPDDADGADAPAVPDAVEVARPRPTAPRRPRAAALLRAAAWIGLALGGAWLWRASTGGADREVPAAVASRPVTVLDPLAGGRREARELAAGDAVVWAGSGELELALAGGATLAVRPGTALVLDGIGGTAGGAEAAGGTPAAVLRAGAVELAVPDAPDAGPVALATPLGELELAAGSRVAARWVDPARDAAGLEELAARARDERAEPERVEVEVLAGRARLRGAEGVPGSSGALSAGETWSLMRLGGRALAVARAEERAALAVLAELEAIRIDATLPLEGAKELRDELDRRLAALEAVLERHPTVWAPLTRALAARFAEPAEYGTTRAPLLDVVAADPTPYALDAAHELWLVDPASFTLDHVLTFAARGGFVFERELEAIVAGWDGGDPVGALFPAIHLALEGSDDALAVVAAAVEEERAERMELVDVLLAAWALDLLGRPEPWRALVDDLDEGLRAALEEESTVRARELVLNAEFVVAERERTRRPELAYLLARLRRHATDEWELLDDPARLEARFERLREAWLDVSRR